MTKFTTTNSDSAHRLFVPNLNLEEGTMSRSRRSMVHRMIVLLLVALMGSLGITQSSHAVTITSLATGNWSAAGTWVGGVAPGLNDEMNILNNHSVTVDVNGQFGGPAVTAISSWENSAETLRINPGITLTHNAGPFAFEISPQAAGANLHYFRGGGTFQNDGHTILRPRTTSAANQYLYDAGTTIQNNGTWEFTDVASNGNTTHQNLQYWVSNSMHLGIDSTGANPGVIDVNMVNGRVATIGMLASNTSGRVTYNGDGGEVPFKITAGKFAFGLPGQGTMPVGVITPLVTDANFKYNGMDFNGDTAALTSGSVMHSTFDRTVFDDLFGSGNTAGPSTAIPTASRVAVGGAFDTIDLISAPTGVMPTNAREHNYEGRIGIGDSGLQAYGNMSPVAIGGTLTIASTTDADWYGGGFNTRGGTIDNNGKLTTPDNETFWYNTNVGNAIQYIGTSTGNGTFNNNVGATIRMEEGDMRINGNTTFNNDGTFEFGAHNPFLRITGAGASFQHNPGGTFTTDPGANNYASVIGDATGSPFNNASGSSITATSGTLRFSPGSFQVNGVTQSTITAATINSNFSVGTGDGIEFMPATAEVVDVDPGALNAGLSAVINGGMAPTTATGNVEFTSQNEVDWRLGHLSLLNGSMTNRGVINKITGSSGYQLNSTNTQRNTFTNLGTFNLTPGSGESYIYQSTTFDNQGLVEIQGSATSWRPVNGGTAALGGIVIHNQSDGIIRGETTLDSQTVYLRFLNAPSGGAGPHELRNEGILESTRGIFRLYGTNAAWYDFQSATSTELTEGTYRVISTGTDRSMLDLEVIDGVTEGTVDSYTGSIVTIGADANLVLSSEEALGAAAGAQFPQLGAISTIDGTMYVHGAVDYDLAPATTVSGTLGGDGTYNATAITFTGSTLDPSALDGGAGTLNINADLNLSNSTILEFYLTSETVGDPNNDMVNVVGNLLLDGVLNVTGPALNKNGTYRLFNYTGSLNDFTLDLAPGVFGGIDTSILGQVNLVVQVPEPSTSMLLGLGLIGLVRCSRRRKNKK